MFEQAYPDLALDAFRHRKISLRFIRARIKALYGVEEARNLEVQTLADLEPDQFHRHPLFWRFLAWRYDEDSIEIEARVAELISEDRNLSNRDAIVKAIGQAIERWSKHLAKEMKAGKEMKLFHPELVEQSLGDDERSEPLQIDMEISWILRLAFERALAEWCRFHETLPGLFVTRTGLATCEAVGEKICSARPPKQDRGISRSSPPNEKGMKEMRRWKRLSPHGARQLVAEAKAAFVEGVAALRKAQ